VIVVPNGPGPLFEISGKFVTVTIVRSALNCSPMETDSTKGPRAPLNVVVSVAIPVNVVSRGPWPTNIGTEAREET
jgi:hypothetical protein